MTHNRAKETHAEGDDPFEKWKIANPGSSFSRYYVEVVLKHVESGAPHPTIGKNLNKAEWHESGAKQFEIWARVSEITPRSKVVDYGCGSLRLGLHFIRFLDAGGYFGLDVVPDFYRIGQELVGEELLKAKSPQFGALSDDCSLQNAVGASADLVIASGVSIHVHPDETAEFFRNLNALTGKPGTRLIFDTMLAEECIRYSDRSWARPLDYYIRALPELQFVRQVRVRDKSRRGHAMKTATLLFQRGSHIGNQKPS